MNLQDKEEIISFDEKFDVWSFGTIVYEMIFKKALFEDTNARAVEDQVGKLRLQWDQVIPESSVKDQTLHQLLKMSLRINP